MTSMPSLHFNRSIESIETTSHRHPTSPASSSRNTAGAPPSLPSRNSNAGRQPPRSAPGALDARQRCLVSSHEDKTIRRTTKVLAIAHKLSDDKVFNMRADDKPSRGSPLRSDALASLTMAGRLDLDGHGSNTSFAGLNAKATADMLVDAGLKRVGVVKFYGCGNGDPSFLAAVKDRLAEKDVEVGYLAGFKREVIEARYPVKLFGKRFNVNPMALFGFPGKAPYAKPWKRASLETTIVKGNADVRFAGTRYDLPPEAAASVKQPVSAAPDRLDTLDRLLAEAGELGREVREVGKGLNSLGESITDTRRMLDAALSGSDAVLPAR